MVPIQKRNAPCSIAFLDRKTAEDIRRYHQSFPDYAVTPLAALPALAGRLGLRKIFVKDESYRFGLNAFKVLGGSYAIGRYLAEQLGISLSDLSYAALTDEKYRKQADGTVFVTATDGNHGRGVAYTARQLGRQAVVYMPAGSSKERFDNIRAEGAQVTITDVNYDDAVRIADARAQQDGWTLVQDTAWEGYEDIPTWIMQGYMTMGLEALEQLGEPPTHIFLQAGVGSMAAAMTGFFSNIYPAGQRPVITIVEPNAADCVFRTAQAHDGRRHFVTDGMNTIMAGLACGEPCSIGWNVLESYADYAVSCPDDVAAQGMRLLGNPLPGDDRVISGESGAVTAGLVREIMENPALAEWKERLGLDAQSVVLCFSTEGDTDRENYRRIVWDGAYAKPETR